MENLLELNAGDVDQLEENAFVWSTTEQLSVTTPASEVEAFSVPIFRPQRPGNLEGERAGGEGF